MILVLVTAGAGCVDESVSVEQHAVEEQSTQDGSSERPLADGEERIAGEHVATLETLRGSKLIFIGHGEGRQEMVSIVSATAPNTPEVFSLPELIDASPLEVFNAVSRAGTPIPETIIRLYGREATLGQQGWALDRLADMENQSGHCNNTSFTGTVESYEYDDHGPRIRLDQEPASDADNVWDFYEDCFDSSWWGGCPSFYRYEVNYSDVDAFYGRVAVCDLGTHETLLSNWGTWVHPGPTIQLSARSPDSADHQVLYHADVTVAQVGTAWGFHRKGPDFDYRLRVTQAEAYDAFDLGTAAEDL